MYPIYMYVPYIYVCTRAYGHIEYIGYILEYVLEYTRVCIIEYVDDRVCGSRVCTRALSRICTRVCIIECVDYRVCRARVCTRALSL